MRIMRFACLIVMLAFGKYSSAQHIHWLGLEQAAGFDPNGQHFVYGDKTIGHYSLGWYTVPGSAEARLSGYGGIRLFTCGKNRFSITETGNIGIGTTTPRSKLEVGVLHASNQDEEMRIGSYYQNRFYGLGLNYRINSKGKSANHLITYRGGVRTAAMSFVEDRVGIGTEDPRARLEVGVRHASNEDEEMRVGSYYQSKFHGLGLNYRINSEGKSANHLITYRGGVRTDAMSFVEDRVGIGTENPQSLLAVAGTITTQEVKVTLEGWSDFVFEEDYKLRKIEEVENYIKANKHLPDIPSAKEVEKEGVALGAMDAKLLQKIEELTLYTIEQEKKIKALEKKNEKMQELEKRLLMLESLLNK